MKSYPIYPFQRFSLRKPQEAKWKPGTMKHVLVFVCR
jgi:hypothetical protein